MPGILPAVSIPKPQHLHDCPRCGYDLTGLITSWSSSCPIRGTCTECGLEQWWGDTLNPARRIPAWSFEHAHRRLPLALISTALRTLIPGRFWSAMRMEFPFVPARLAALCLGGCLMPYIGFAIGYAIWEIGLSVVTGYGGPFAWLRNSDSVFFVAWPRSLLGSVTPGELIYYQWRHMPLVTWWILLAAILMPLLFLLLPQTLRTARVRPRHRIRIWLYGLPSLLAIICVPLVVSDALDGIQLLRWRTTYFSGSAIDWDSLQQFMWENSGTAEALLGCLWLLLWWSLACSRYLRLPRAWWIAIALLAISLMLAATPFIFFPAIGVPWMSQLNLS